MSLSIRDKIASTLVLIAVAVYYLWLLFVDATATGTRLIAGVVLLLGFAASATAVVPAFNELLHGSRLYLAVTSVIGLFAAVVGVVSLVQADAGMLAALGAATFVMWVMATVRHLRAAAADDDRARHRPSAGRPTSVHA